VLLQQPHLQEDLVTVVPLEFILYNSLEAFTDMPINPSERTRSSPTFASRAVETGARQENDEMQISLFGCLCLNVYTADSTSLTPNNLLKLEQKRSRATRDSLFLWQASAVSGTLGVRTPAATDPLPLSVTVERVPSTSDWEATVVYRHAGGGSNIRATQLLINTAVDGAFACYIGFDHAANVGYLFSDEGGGLIAQGIVPGAAGSVSNSQCGLSGLGSSRVIAGDLLRLKLRLSFMSGFRRRLFIADAGVQGAAGSSSGWQALLGLTAQ